MNRLDLVAEPGVRETLLYVRGARGPVSAENAAAALGVHRTVARHRLERLLAAELVEATFERRTGRTGPGAGRPAKVYAAAPEAEAIELPPRRLPALVGRLLDELPARGRERALRHAGEGFGHDLAHAAGLRARVHVGPGLEQVCVALRSLGFQASLESIDRDTAVVTTPTCPLRPLVTEHPEAARIDEGMWAGLVEQAVRGVSAASVECETHSCHDTARPCSVVIRLRRFL